MKVREIDATWDGNINDGQGVIDLGNNGNVTFTRDTRLQDENDGKNPETIAAGAIAGSYGMALARELAGAGFTPSSIAVSARVILEQTDDGLPFIPTVNLSARVQVNKIKHEEFMTLAESARAHCPISNLFAGAEVTLEADMVGG